MSNLDEYNKMSSLKSSYDVSGTNYKGMPPMPTPMPTPAPAPAPMPTPMPAEAMQYKIMYPEVFYRLQPYIIMVCDEMDMCGCQMPSQQMIERMTDSIHDDICKMYPDMKGYVEDNKPQTLGDPPFDSDFRRRFRRRGLFRDLIDILLLSEFSRRRRRYYY